MFAGRVSSRTTWRWRSLSSAASSIVTTRSCSPMKPDRMLSSVVLPAPVPPDTMTFSRQATAASRKSFICVGPRLAADQVVGAELVGAEAADRHRRAVERQRRNDRVHARSVGQPRVHHRAGLVDAPADRADDALDNLLQVALVLEGDLGRLEPPVPFDVDLVVPVHQDVRDRRIGEQDFERTETEQLVQDVADDALALVEAERGFVSFPVEHAADERTDFGFRVFALDPGQPIEVEPVEQILVDAALQLLIRRVPSVRSRRSGFDRRSRFDDC